MAKLGYTWYPKDWGNSEKVFELNLSERGLYRELIDMAMLNDNKTITNYKTWARKFNVDIDDILDIMEKLSLLELIIFTDNKKNEDLPSVVFIPSCEPRLNLVRGGSNGGKKSRKNKPNNKPNNKPFVSSLKNNDKPDGNQIEIETKIETKTKIKKEVLNSKIWIDEICMKKRIELNVCLNYLNTFLDDADLKDELNNVSDTKRHFVNWLNIQLRQLPKEELKTGVNLGLKL